MDISCAVLRQQNENITEKREELKHSTGPYRLLIVISPNGDDGDDPLNDVQMSE